MKLREADQITQSIMTDSWQNCDGMYDHAEDGQYFVIAYDNDTTTVSVHVGAKVVSRKWLGCKDNLTNDFREWLQKAVNVTLKGK